MEQRISDINMSLEAQLYIDLEKCCYFSIVLDELTDVQDKPQLVVFMRSVSENCTIKEELLDIVSRRDPGRKSVFSTLNQAKSKHRFVLTDTC